MGRYHPMDSDNSAVHIARKEQTMKGFDNNEMSVRTLQNLKNSLDNRIHEIYNQGYREGYKDGVKDAMQKIADNILSEVADDEDN